MQNEKVSCEVIPQESVFENLRFSVLILVDDLDSKVVKLFESFFAQDPEAFLVVVCSCNHKCEVVPPNGAKSLLKIELV